MADGDGVVVCAFLRGLCDKTEIAAAAAGGAGGREISRISKALRSIYPLLGNAEEQQLEGDDALRDWLRNLKQAAYDLDDLLDSPPIEAAPAAAARRGGGGGVSATSLCFFFLLCRRGDRSSSPSSSPKSAMRAIRERIEGLANRKDFPDLENYAGSTLGRVSKSAGTDSMPCPPAGMLGMDEERERFVKMLLSDHESGESTNLSVVSVTGRHGVGKTTFARLAYEDEIIATHFDLRLWIDAHEVFDTRELFASILQKMQEDTSSHNAAGQVEERLVEALLEKRFLLVLDEPWHDKIKWWMVRKYLEVGAKGSKVVIVTNDDRMAKALGEHSAFAVEGLSAEDCWALLKAYAFVDDVIQITASEEFEAVGRKITSQLQGLPLSAKMIGSLLRPHPQLPYWRMIENANIWKRTPAAAGDANGIPPALWLSYKYLPPDIKQCLAYCSVFPRHHEYERDAMTEMWMAQGFFVRPEGRRRKSVEEDQGNEVFDYLVNRSFLQCLEASNKFVMYGHVHDLVMSLSWDETLQLGVGDAVSIRTAKKVRHLLLFSDHLKQGFDFDPGTFESVRTLVFYGLIDPRFDFNEFLAKLKILSVLCLNAPSIERLPKPICSMEKLRYLDLRFTSIRELPKEVCYNLRNLQTLKLHKAAVLPDEISKLTKLRHLEADNDKISRINWVGKLISLQEMKKFAVFGEDGHKIAELKDMNELQGELLIMGLENVRSKEEAAKANLMKKQRLQKLELEWSVLGSFTYPEPRLNAVIEGLKPHTNLKELVIRNHLGSRFPSWLGDKSFSNLESIEIHDCCNWKLVPLGELPSLKSLVLEVGYRASLDKRGSMPNVRRAGPELYGRGSVAFPALEKLCISGAREWEEWDTVGNGRLFPRLLTLVVDNCINMKELPNLPLSITELKLKAVGLVELPGLQELNSTSPLYLQSLHISCMRLSSLRGLMSYPPKALKKLTISHCENIVSLPENGLSDLIFLETLEISMCPRLVCLSHNSAALPSSLLHLNVHGCPYLTSDSFFVCLEKLHSLVTLNIGGANKLLRLIPGERLMHLSSLVELKIEKCEELKILGFMALKSLKHLEISCCPKLLATSSLVDQEPLFLESLRITGCSLQILSWDVLRRLNNLQELTLDRCSGQFFLEEVDQEFCHLASLRRLAVTCCYELESLPRELGTIPNLEELCIMGCPKVQSLPEKPLPPTLVMFSIDDCYYLKDRCEPPEQSKPGGVDWPKIAHVPTINFYFTKKFGRQWGSMVDRDHLDSHWIPHIN